MAYGWWNSYTKPGSAPGMQMNSNNPPATARSGGGGGGWIGDTLLNSSKGMSGRATTTPRGTPGATPGTGDAGSARGVGNNTNPYGSQSGLGILGNWFNQRVNGTDPAYEYAMNRGMQTLGDRSAAAGNFNSGAARQQESDFAANMAAQRMGQLDALAGAYSGEQQNRLNSMFAQGLGLAGGQAGQASAYDLGAAGNMAAANQAQQQMALAKAGVDQKANQGLLSNAMNLYALYQGGGGGGGGGSPYPV